MSASFSSILTVFKRQWIPTGLTLASVMVGAVAYLMYTPKVYETSARLILAEKRVSVSELGRDLARLGETVPGEVNPIATQAEFAKSQRVLKRAVEKLASRGDQNLPELELLSKSLRVKIIPGTNILELSYQNRDPKTAANLVNAVMESIVEENIESIRAPAQSVKIFLQREVLRQREVLQQVEREENLYRQTNRLISVADQTRKLVDSLGDQENQERSLSAQLQEVAARNASLKQVIGTGSLKSAYESVRIGQDEELKALRIKLANLETKVIDERARLGDSNPDLLATLEQRNEVRSLYEKRLAPFSPKVVPANQNTANASIPQINIANDALSQDLISKLIASEVEQVALEQKMLTIQQEKSDLQSRLADVPVKQQPLTNLVRSREAAETNLKQLQSKLQEATIAEAQLVSNIQIIYLADIPVSAEWPKKPVVILIAIFFGLILVVVEVIFLELIDNSLHDSNEVENILKLPNLGGLPTLPDNLIDFNLDAFLDNGPLVEPYYKLLQSLKFRSVEKLRTLVISSAQINEGKSTVAAYLAIAGTMSSQKILLIDANLRDPSQHKLFNLSSKFGLSDVIHGQLVLNEAIQSTEIKNLSILSVGKSSSRQFLELESEEMQSILKTVVEIFDLVIIDTPAINDFSDAITLSRYSDALLLVVRNKISTRNGLNQAVTETTKNGVTMTGFVTNDIKTSPSTNYPSLNYNGSINGHKSDTMVKTLKFLPFYNKSRKP